MNPSTIIRIRRRVGRWTTHCHPEPEEREALAALDSGPPNVVRDWAALTHALIDESPVVGEATAGPGAGATDARP